VLSGKGTCVGLITIPEKSYQMCCLMGLIEKPHRGGQGPLEGEKIFTGFVFTVNVVLHEELAGSNLQLRDCAL
jgi:hypothetical protein